MHKSSTTHGVKASCNCGGQFVPVHSSVNGTVCMRLEAMAIGSFMIRKFVEVFVEQIIDSTLRNGGGNRRTIHASIVRMPYKIANGPPQGSRFTGEAQDSAAYITKPKKQPRRIWEECKYNVPSPLLRHAEFPQINDAFADL